MPVTTPQNELQNRQSILDKMVINNGIIHSSKSCPNETLILFSNKSLFNKIFNLISIYSPNLPNEQVDFLEKLHNLCNNKKKHFSPIYLKIEAYKMS